MQRQNVFRVDLVNAGWRCCWRCLDLMFAGQKIYFKIAFLLFDEEFSTHKVNILELWFSYLKT